MGEPRGIGDVICFLCSPGEPCLTGQTIIVDGGGHVASGQEYQRAEMLPHHAQEKLKPRFQDASRNPAPIVARGCSISVDETG